MKLRTARAGDAGTGDVTIVPLFDDLTPPAGLGRTTRAIVERMAREHGRSTSTCRPATNYASLCEAKCRLT